MFSRLKHRSYYGLRVELEVQQVYQVCYPIFHRVGIFLGFQIRTRICFKDSAKTKHTRNVFAESMIRIVLVTIPSWV